jgi:copper chaperone
MEQIELNVAGMTCGGCASRVKQALLDVPGVHSAEVDLTNGVARARADNARALQPALIQAVTEAGYPATPVGSSAGSPRTGGGCCGH